MFVVLILHFKVAEQKKKEKLHTQIIDSCEKISLNSGQSSLLFSIFMSLCYAAQDIDAFDFCKQVIVRLT